MTAWLWVSIATIYAVHDRQIAEHGGLDGLRDKGLVESVLARPRNPAAYGDPDVATLAAAYVYGFARGHAFADGNKRLAWTAARIFLADNGARLRFDPVEAVSFVQDIAAGTTTEGDAANWLRSRIVPDPGAG